jgi:signal transduction histidine kinase/AraC-like DNA-binding protein
LWITAFEGTFKFRIDRTSHKPTLTLEKKYTEKDGMQTKAGASNLFTAAMVEDNGGNLWLGQVGLTRLDPKTHQMKVYDEDDGMPGSTISQPMAARLSSGHLAFGTNRGAFLFHPDSLKDNETVPPIVLTDFTLLNQTGMLLKDEYELNHNQNVMTFEFAALDFTAPEKNQYAYQMVGFDPDWVYSGTRRIATYTNLDPGTYTFRVKGSNNDSVWNEVGTSVKIVILPPPWRTWWAYSLYGAALLIILWLARNEIIKRERLRNEFQLKKIEADKYHELDTMKSRFFANISHEFRTPLTLILGPIQKRLMLAEGTDDKVELGLIQRNAQRLLKLVNQLLDLSRLEAGTMSLKCSANDLVAFTRFVVQSFHSMAEAKGIKYAFESKVNHLELFFDQEKLEKIIINLLSNAFKFTPAGGEITVVISSTTVKDTAFKEGFAEILVCDSGIGIPPEHLEKIFDRFYQVDSSQTREYEGTGIGLALTKELVDLHHGSITVVCNADQGTAFTVRLPLGKGHLRSSEIQQNITRESTPETTESPLPHTRDVDVPTPSETIMIVEDNADLRYYLHENLRSTYNILEASDGEDGLTLAFEKIPDLIISDLMMPRMDGVQLSHRLKNDERTSHIPIVLLTAKADSETKIQGLELGADDYIPKPFDMKELLVRVRNLIEGRKKLREKYSSQLDLGAKKVELHVKKVKAFSVDERFLQKALDIVDKNIASSSFGVEMFAHEVGMSTAQLYRKLTALTGYSPNDFVRHVRLQRAADLLSQQAGNISEIAYDTGFNNLSYFSKCFKEKFGVTPSEYINK